MLILALIAVLMVGFYQCFSEAKLAWKARNYTGLTAFERRSNICKAGSMLSLIILALISLLDAAKGVFW